MAARRSPNPPSDPRARLTTWAELHDIELLFLDPPETFDAAILGVLYGFNQAPAVLYDEKIVLSKLVESGMTIEDAQEYFDFNTVGGWHGDATPRFLMVGLDDA